MLITTGKGRLLSLLHVLHSPSSADLPALHFIIILLWDPIVILYVPPVLVQVPKQAEGRSVVHVS